MVELTRDAWVCMAWRDLLLTTRRLDLEVREGSIFMLFYIFIFYVLLLSQHALKSSLNRICVHAKYLRRFAIDME